MSGPAERFLDDFAREGWTDETHPRFLALVEEHPEALPTLLRLALEQGMGRQNFLGEAVSFIPPDALAEVVDVALAGYQREDAREAAGDILAHAALQLPRLFHPRLTEVFERGVNAGGYEHSWPWRESGELHHAYLLGVIGLEDERAGDALDCLLETRTPAVLELALANGLEAYVYHVGHEPAEGGGCRALYPAAAYHVRFPDGYRDLVERPPHLRTIHPTWSLEAGDAPAARFGGAGEATCTVCGEEAHHLLTLDPVPPGIGVTSVPALVLEVCFRCVWTNPDLWWKHDEAGRPTPHRLQMGGTDPENETPPLREAEVRLVPTPARWYWQDWGASNGRENLTRLGGHPCWIQDADYPGCPDCGRTMAFLLQVDADLPGEEEDSIAFEEGILYTFWCDACRVSVSAHQQT